MREDNYGKDRNEMKQSPLNMGQQESGHHHITMINELKQNRFPSHDWGIWNALQDLRYPDDDRFPEAVAGLQFTSHVEARTLNNALKPQADAVKDTS